MALSEKVVIPSALASDLNFLKIDQKLCLYSGNTLTAKISSRLIDLERSYGRKTRCYIIMADSVC